MDTVRLLELLRNQDVEENKQELMEYQNTDPIGLATQLAQILLLDECDTQIAQICAVNLKAVLMMCSRVNIEKFISFWAEFPEENKQVLRDGLIRGLTFDDPSVIPNAVGEIISLICLADFGENIWNELIDILLGIIQSDDYVSNAKYACILTIDEILRRPIKWLRYKNKETFRTNTIEACKFILENNPDANSILTTFDTLYRCLTAFKLSLKKQPQVLDEIADYFLAVKEELSSSNDSQLKQIVDAMYRYAVTFCVEYSKTGSQEKVEEVIQAILNDIIEEDANEVFRTEALNFITKVARYEYRYINDSIKNFKLEDSYINALAGDIIEPILQMLAECDAHDIECGDTQDTSISQYAKRAISYICRIVPEAREACFEFFKETHESENWNERFAGITAATAILMGPSEEIFGSHISNETLQIHEYISEILGGDPSALSALLEDEALRVRFMALAFIRRTIRHHPTIIKNSDNAETVAAHIFIALQSNNEATAAMGWTVAMEFFELYNPSMDNFTNKLSELDGPFVEKYFELLSADFATNGPYVNAAGSAMIVLMKNAPHSNIELRQAIIQQTREVFATLDGPDAILMQSSILLIQAIAVNTMLDVPDEVVNECATFLLSLMENEDLIPYIVGAIGVLVRRNPRVLENCVGLVDQVIEWIDPSEPNSHINLLLIFLSDVFQNAPDSISNIEETLDRIITFTQEVMNERADNLPYAINAICYGLRVAPGLYPQFEERIIDIRRNIMDRKIEDKKSDFVVYGPTLANLCLLNATSLIMNASNPEFFTAQNKREIFAPFRMYSPYYLTHSDSFTILNALLLMFGKVMERDYTTTQLIEVNPRQYNSELNNQNIRNIINRGRIKFYKYYRHNTLAKIVSSLISKA